jgi:hypothetical protein
LTAHTVHCLGFRAATPWNTRMRTACAQLMEWRMTRQCVRLLAVVLVVATLMLLFVLMATFFPA